MKGRWMGAIVFAGCFSLLESTAAHTLSGTVINQASSQPLSGIKVELAVLLPDSISFFDVSTAAGAYAITGYPDGNQIYVIRCYAPGYYPFYMRYDALALGDRQVDILLQPGGTSPPGPGEDSSTVSGAVLYEMAGGATNPVSQAVLTFTASRSQAVTQTGDDGRYSVRLPRSSYGLTVTATGFQNLTVGTLPIDSAGLTLNVLVSPTAVGVEDSAGMLPQSFFLADAFPNPSNPGTTIRYNLPRRSQVLLTVYTILGEKVAELVSGEKEAGTHEIRFTGTALASGVYVYQLRAGSYVQTKRFVLLR